MCFRHSSETEQSGNWHLLERLVARTFNIDDIMTIFGLLKNQREVVREDVREVDLLDEFLICTGIE